MRYLFGINNGHLVCKVQQTQAGIISDTFTHERQTGAKSASVERQNHLKKNTLTRQV